MTTADLLWIGAGAVAGAAAALIALSLGWRP